MPDEPRVVEVGDDDADGRRHASAPSRRTAAPIDDEPLRILIITDFYWPYLGGVEQHVRSLGAALTGRGHRVVVATLGRADLPTVESDGDVVVRRLRSTTQRLTALFSSSDRPWAPPLPDPAIVRQLRRLVAEHRPDIVHGHDWLARSFLPLRRWSARRYGTRFVSTLHYYTLSCARKNLMEVVAPADAGDEAAGDIAAEVRCSGPGAIKCLRCATRHYGAATGAITAAGNAIGAAAERRGATTIVAVSAATARGNGLTVVAPAVRVVANFLPPVAPAPPVDGDGDVEPAVDGDVEPAVGPGGGDAVERLLDSLPAERFLLFVGDIRPMKGVDVLLEAYAALATDVPLVLIGKRWPDSPTTYPTGVVVHDRWPNAAVVAAWRRCTVAVVPSVWAEPFGLVVIEAMAGGAAVVASDVGGIGEIVVDGESGLLVPPGRSEPLRAALAALLDDPPLRAALGSAAATRAEAFTAEVVVPELIAVYREASTRSRRSRSTDS